MNQHKSPWQAVFSECEVQHFNKCGCILIIITQRALRAAHLASKDFQGLWDPAAAAEHGLEDDETLCWSLQGISLKNCSPTKPTSLAQSRHRKVSTGTACCAQKHFPRSLELRSLLETPRLSLQISYYILINSKEQQQKQASCGLEQRFPKRGREPPRSPGDGSEGSPAK